MKTFHIMMMLMSLLVLALALVAFGWYVSHKIFGTHVTVECYPGQTLAHIPLEIKQLCIKVEVDK